MLTLFRNSIRENVTTYLYGCSKKDNINYNILNSIEKASDDKENVCLDNSDSSKSHSNDNKRILLPGFCDMMQHVYQQTEKRLGKNDKCVMVGKVHLPYPLNTYEEVNLIRVTSTPGVTTMIR